MKNYQRKTANGLLFSVILLSVIWIPVLLLTTCTTVSKVDYAHLGNAEDKIPLTSRAITGTLPNGLRYFIMENKMPENRAILSLVVNAGSVLERDDQRGFAHFVEHLAFNDTARFPKLELIEYLRSLGMRFGPDANAYTSYNETVYHFDVPVENDGGVKKIPAKALAILDDWTHAVSFLPEDVASESLVVLEEMRTRLGAMDRVRKITLPILFKGSAYESRDVIGLPEIIESASSDQLKEFYDRWYTSDNMTLVFVGDFDGKVLEAELAEHFNMPAATRSVNRPLYELPPPQKGNFHTEIIIDPELTQSGYIIYYKQKPSAQRGTLSYYRETMIDYLISVMFNQRLEEAMADPQVSATDSWGDMWRWASNSRFYQIMTYSKTGRTEDALRELLLEKEEIRRFGFTQSELDRAKLDLISYMEKMMSEKDRTESRTFIRSFTSHILYGEDMADIEWEVDAVNTLLPGIGINEIKEAAGNYFSHNDCIVFLIAPQAEEGSLPSKQRIREIFDETEKAEISSRQDTFVSGDLLDSPPQSGAIIDEVQDIETGAVILTLNNGAKVILKETANRNNEIIMYAIAKGGTVNVPLDEMISAGMASEMSEISGLGPYSRIELVNKLAGKQVSFSFFTSNYSRGFQASSTISDIKTLFEMIHLFFVHPKFDERAIEAMLDQYRTSLLHQEDDTESFFWRELSRVLYNYHPRFKPMELEDLEKVSLEQAFAFINRCINPADYTFVFTGNINVSEIKKLSESYIASIPRGTSAMNNWTDPGITRPGNITRVVYKGQDERSMVYLAWFALGPAVFNEGINQTAAVLSEYLDIVLTNEIREKMGGVYSIYAGSSVSVIPKGEYRLNVYFQCSPARAEELIAAVMDKIREIAEQQLDMDTFNKSKEALIMEHERSIQRNIHIAQSYVNSFVLYNTPLSRLNLRSDAVRAVTAEAVRALCRNLLVNGPVQVVLYPETTNR